MVEIINSIVSIALLIIFTMGCFSCITVNKKYRFMLKTIEGEYNDNDIIRIEKSYQHNLVDRHNTRMFVEKNYYSIKVLKIPIHILEDVAINSMYYTVLIGLTFTFIELALISNGNNINLQGVFICSIVGLAFGLLLLGIRMICGLVKKREMFTVYMCNYLSNVLKLDLEKEDEDDIKDSKVQSFKKEDYSYYKNTEDISQYNNNRAKYLSNNSKIPKEKASKLDESIFEELIEQIMS